MRNNVLIIACTDICRRATNAKSVSALACTVTTVATTKQFLGSWPARLIGVFHAGCLNIPIYAWCTGMGIAERLSDHIVPRSVLCRRFGICILMNVYDKACGPDKKL
jgi:hypothetical protein